MSFASSHAGPSMSSMDHYSFSSGSANTRGTWSPETSPSSSEGSNSNDDRMHDHDHDDHDERDAYFNRDSTNDDIFLSTSPTPSPPLSQHSLLGSERPSINITHSTPSPVSVSASAPLSRSPKSGSPTSPLLIHPYRPHPRPSAAASRLAPLSSMPKANLPKSQPLSRALFARMASSDNVPHAGLLGSKKMQTGGKQKMIVATKPMRTTFELGLTASELARRA